MKLPNEYLEDLLVRMSHHSNAIENNTITLPETVSIIVHSVIPNNVSLREFYEIDNHRYAMEYVLSADILEENFSMDILLKTHEILMDKLHHEKGRFKSQDNAIIGADFDTASPAETPLLMKQWVDNTNFRLDLAKTKREIITVICESHIEFERIHPFADGNGRIGRLMMTYLFLKNNLPPLIIEGKEKATYTQFLANRDIEGFSDFTEKKLTKEKERMEAFENSQSNDL